VDSTRDRIREAALRLFVAQSFEGTGIRDIAAASGITTATLYHYMSVKDDLLIEIIHGLLPRAVQAARESVEQAGRVEEQLATLVELHVWILATRSMSAWVTESEFRRLRGEVRTEILRLRDAYEELWRETVRRGVEEGVFQVEDVKLTTWALMGMCADVSWWYLPEGRLDLRETCRMFADLALAMVRAQRDSVPLHAAELSLPDPAGYFPLEEREESAGRVYRQHTTEEQSVAP
jgi:AcrR family transcriptional regulator